ncbi:alanine racemase [Microbacterium sp. EF45047]|nr:alanine racemase [Microbacterium neungamense]WCM56830.1 alanine racemase [Microbacterium sp. EF45047]
MIPPAAGPTLRISHRRFLANIDAVRMRIAPSELMLVMKDDAYGHGLEWAVDAARGDVDLFGGYDIPTSLRIAARAPGARVFAWATSAQHEVEEALHAGVELGVGTTAYLRRVIAAAERLGRRARVHLKIDTGLRRNGMRPEEWPEAVAEAAAAQRAGLLDVAGVWSHLAEASDEEDDAAAAEFRRAVAAVRTAGARPAALHLTASAASWWRPELRGSVCRIGAFCYGIRSADGPEIPGVRPIAALTAPVIAADGDGGDAVIGIGALHGLPSTLAGVRIATPAGLRELTRIDELRSSVRGWPGAAPGQEVRLFGPGAHGEPDATALAERIGTVGEEIVTRLTPAVGRVVTAA